MAHPDWIVRVRLAAISAVTALVSTRIYGLKVRQGSDRPYVRVQRISRSEPFHARGPIGIKEARVQVDCVANTKLVAEQLIDAVHGDGLGDTASGLSGWKGEIGSPAVVVRGIFPLDDAEDFTSEELEIFRMRRDYRVVWSD